MIKKEKMEWYKEIWGENAGSSYYTPEISEIKSKNRSKRSQTHKLIQKLWKFFKI